MQENHETQEPIDHEESRCKRLKRSHVQERLFINFQSNFGAWGPVVCALLYQHANCLNHEFMENCLSHIAECACKLSDSSIDLKVEDTSTQVIWVLRSAYFLASFWNQTSCIPNSKEEWVIVKQAVLKVNKCSAGSADAFQWVNLPSS